MCITCVCVCVCVRVSVCVGGRGVHVSPEVRYKRSLITDFLEPATGHVYRHYLA